jgi:hypothetical protein
MVLGHTPDDRALAALRRHAAQGGAHDGMARLAAAECAWWQETGALEPQWPQANPMLN